MGEEKDMFKWILGGIAVIILLLVIVQPEWLKVFNVILHDYIQANE